MKNTTNENIDSTDPIATEAYEHGKVAGAWWADRDADVDQLERLQGALEDDAIRPWYESMFEECEHSAFSVTERLAFTILGDEAERYDSDGFWYEHGDGVPGALLHTSAFARGFADGAMSVWSKSEIQG